MNNRKLFRMFMIVLILVVILVSAVLVHQTLAAKPEGEGNIPKKCFDYPKTKNENAYKVCQKWDIQWYFLPIMLNN